MGTIVHTFSTAGAWSDTAPAGTVSAVIVMNGGGGNGGPSVKGANGNGAGGGAQLSYSIVSLSPGDPLSGNIGIADSGDTTCTQYSLTAGTGTDGTAGGTGVGGTWSGSGASGSNGGNGGGTNVYNGGGSPGGGAQQTTLNANGNAPGGGGAANGGLGAAGQVVITYTTLSTHSQTASVSTSQSVHDKKQAGKHNHILSGEFVSTLKATTFLVGLISTEFVSATKGFVRSYSVATPQHVSAPVRSSIRTLFVTEAESVSNKNAVQTIIQAISSSQRVRLVNSIVKKISITSVEVIGLVRVASHFRGVISASAQSASDIKTAFRSFSSSLAETSHAVAVRLRIVSSDVSSGEHINFFIALSKKVSLGQQQVVASINNSVHTIKVISNETAFALRQIVKKISYGSVESVRSFTNKTTSLPIGVVEDSFVSLINTINILRSVGEAQVIALSRASVRGISITSAETVHVLRAIARTITSTSSEVVATTNSVKHIISVALAESVQVVRHLPKHVLATSTEVVSSFTQKVKIRAFGTSEAQAISFLRTVLKVASVSSPQTINYARAIVRYISVPITEIVNSTNAVTNTIGTFLGNIANLLTQRGHQISVAQAQLVNMLTGLKHRRRMAIWMRKQKNFH